MQIQFQTRSPLRDFLYFFFKRKAQILVFFIATVYTVTMATFMVRPTYEAKAQILLKMGRQNLYIPSSSSNGQIISYSLDDQINSEIELLRSRSLAEKVIRSLGTETILGPKSAVGQLFDTCAKVIHRFITRQQTNISFKNAIITFQKSLAIEHVRQSEVITIKFKHKEPKTAALIVNKTADIYLDEHLLVHKDPQSYGFFEEQSQILKDKLEQAQERLKAFKKNNDVTDLDEQRRLFLHHISDLRAELNHTLSRKAETDSRIRQISQQRDKTPETIPQWEEVDYSPSLISNLKARLIELQVKEKELRNKYTPQSRLIQNVEEEIHIVQNNLAEMENKRYGKSRIGVNDTYQQLQMELFRNQAENKALAAKEDTLNNQITDCQTKLEHLNRIVAKLNNFQQAVDLTRQNYRLYLSKIEESRISDAMYNKKISNAVLMEPALPPLKPVSPNKLLNLVLGLFLGVFGGVGLALLMEYLDDSLESPEQVEITLNLPVLTSVPEFKTRLPRYTSSGRQEN